MADQGFEHNLPVIVLPKANQQQLTAIMRRLVHKSKVLFSVYLSVYWGGIRIYEEIEVYMYIYIKKYNLFVTFLIRSFELLLGRAVLWVDVAFVTIVL